MKKNYFILTILLFLSVNLLSQNPLEPVTDEYKVSIPFNSTNIYCAEITNNHIYTLNSSAIECYDINTLNLVKSYQLAPNYNAFAGFIKISPDSKYLWVGFTVTNNTNDRIYKLNLETNEWTHVANFPGNFDLEFFNNIPLVSGLNSSDQGTPNSIFILDTIVGGNNHRKIVEVGGSSAGLAIDKQGNIYYGTYYFTGQNKLLKWGAADVQNAISNNNVTLTLNDAVTLSYLSSGCYDCSVDKGYNVTFTSNPLSAAKFVGKWNGTAGESENFNQIAVATSSSAWLTTIKNIGNLSENKPNCAAYVLGYGMPMVKVAKDIAPQLVKPLPNYTVYADADNAVINLNEYFNDPDDDIAINYSIMSNSNTSAASVTINNSALTIDFLAEGLSKILIKAATNSTFTISEITINILENSNFDFTPLTFEDLTISNESYWNGSDLSGGFQSGLGVFHNSYDTAYYSWNGWAYSNMSDVTTPGWGNQFSAITGSGIFPSISGGKNYGIANVPSDYTTSLPKPITLKFNDNSSHKLEGMYVTNTTYAYLDMQTGSQFSKKFGGESGNDPDWFKLSVWGVRNNGATDTVHFYLADYRFADNSQDYIVNTWQWVDLKTIGKADSIKFRLTSSDVGAYGMNTPAYFAIDNIYIKPDLAPIVQNPLPNIEVKINSPEKIIDLSNVFVDPDDESVNMEIGVKLNSNPGLVQAVVSQNKLHLAFTPNTIGKANITLYALSNGKSVENKFEVSVVKDDNIDELALNNFTIYPNPSSNGVFNIKSNLIENCTIKIVSLDGKIVYTDNHYLNNSAIVISDKPQGNYVMQIIKNGKSFSRLIVIK